MKYPYNFDDYKICVHCGKKAVVPINIYEKEDKEFINQIGYLKCKSCGREYFIKWKDEVNSVEDNIVEKIKIPVVCDEEEKEDTINNITAEAFRSSLRNKIN